jgi:ribonuclease HII
MLNPSHRRPSHFRQVAGVDEAGRGPWAGPVVAAAVILHRFPLAARIDDSKRLTSRERLQAFDVIQTHAAVGFGIACAEEIDRWNILRASTLAMQRAVEDLPRRPRLVLVDGPMTPPLPIPCYALVHGDQRNYLIGCASIMAKVLRDRLMAFYHDLEPDYAFSRHKGYGTALHAMRLKQFGVSVFHRRSFAPVRQLLERAR